MTFKLYCRNEQSNFAEIWFILSHKGKPYKIKTGEVSPLNSEGKPVWDHKAQMIPNKFNGASVINQRLKKASIALEDICNSLKEFDLKKIKELFYQYLKERDTFKLEEATQAIVEAEDKAQQEEEAAKKKEEYERLHSYQKGWTAKQKEQFHKYSEGAREFYAAVELVISDHRNQWSEEYKRNVRSFRTKIIGNIHDPANKGRVKIEGMDPLFFIKKFSLGWWQDYIDYCFDERDNSHNTVQTDFKVMHNLCDVFKSKGIAFNHDVFNADMSYIEPRIEPVEWQEVAKIANVDLSSYSEAFQDARFIWVLGAYLGQRWRDILRLTPHSFLEKNVKTKTGTVKRWFYTNRQQKTKQLIEVRMLDEALAWLKRRNFVIPKIANNIVNLHIKEIAKMAGLDYMVSSNVVVRGEVEQKILPKWATIHFHTARHTYAVELVKRSIGKPFYEKFVAEMLGHASMATVWKYINFVSSQKDIMFEDLISGEGKTVWGILQETYQKHKAAIDTYSPEMPEFMVINDPDPRTMIIAAAAIHNYCKENSLDLAA